MSLTFHADVTKIKQGAIYDGSFSLGQRHLGLRLVRSDCAIRLTVVISEGEQQDAEFGANGAQLANLLEV